MTTTTPTEALVPGLRPTLPRRSVCLLSDLRGEHVLGRHLQTTPGGPLAKLGELVAGFLLVGGDAGPDGAPGGHELTTGIRADGLRLQMG